MSRILEALKRKDPADWEVVYDGCVSGLYSYCLYRLRNADEAEDVVQEAFVRAFECIEAFRPADAEGDIEAQFRWWLRGIARRVLSRRARALRPGAARAISLDAICDGVGSGLVPPDPGPSASRRLIALEDGLRAGAALGALPDNWEKALRWKYQEDWSVARIAEALGITAKAAESVLSRARVGFREAYRTLSENADLPTGAGSALPAGGEGG